MAVLIRPPSSSNRTDGYTVDSACFRCPWRKLRIWPGNHILPILLVGFFSATLGGAGGDAQTAPAREYQVKAVFLFNFAQFVEWPPQAFPTPQTPLVIGVLGEDPFGAYLDEAVRDEKVNDRPLVVQRYRRVEEIKSCHVLFISRSETDQLERILVGLKGRSVLTVGDAEGFAQHGGMIRFVTEKSKIRLRINLEAAKAANLTISSKLLRPAEIVTSERE